MDELDLIGSLLKDAVISFARAKLRDRDLYLGKVTAYKRVLDVTGNGKYAWDMIDEAFADMIDNDPPSKIKSAMQGIMRG